MTSRTFRLLLTIVMLSSPAAAQAPRQSSDAQALSRGWTALAAGRAAEAVSLADEILQKKPRSHAAISLKLEALSSGTQPIPALDVYEAWLTKAAHNVDDRGLLQPIAVGLLRVVAAGTDVAARSIALQRLAEFGDETASAALRKFSAEGDQRSTMALADRGDAQATTTLQTLVASGSGRDVSAAIDVLAERGALQPSVLDALLNDRVPMNRAAAIRALGRSKAPNAAQRLEALAQDRDPLVRYAVRLAKAESGDAKALSDARAMLGSEVADIRLMAAEALQPAMPAEVEQAIRPLLTNRDGNYRFRAAAIVGKTDPAAVQSVLIEGLGDPNPGIQQEAARVSAEALSGDVVLLRQLLRHRDPLVVASAAGAILTN
jgi:HEAT repeat protein